MRKSFRCFPPARSTADSSSKVPVPIAQLIENVIGVHSVDAFSRKAEWRLPEQCSGKLDMKNLHFGGMETSLEYGNGVCTAAADSPYTLTVNNKEHPIHAGEQRFSS